MMIDGTDLQVHTLQTAESAFDIGEPLIVSHYLFTAEFLLGNVGADDVNAVQRRLSFNIVRLALEAKTLILNEQLEVFAHLKAAQNAAHRQADFFAAAQWFSFPLCRFHDFVELLFRGFQQLIALTGSLFGQQRIETRDQALSWIGGMLNLSQVVLIE